MKHLVLFASAAMLLSACHTAHDNGDMPEHREMRHHTESEIHYIPDEKDEYRMHHRKHYHYMQHKDRGHRKVPEYTISEDMEVDKAGVKRWGHCPPSYKGKPWC